MLCCRVTYNRLIHDWRKALNDLAVMMRMENYMPEAYVTSPWCMLWSFFPLQCTGNHIPRTRPFLLRVLDCNLTALGEVDSVTLFENCSSFLHHWLRACGIPGTLLVYIISHNGSTTINAPSSQGHPSDRGRTGTRCLVSTSLVTPQVSLDLNKATSYTLIICIFSLLFEHTRLQLRAEKIYLCYPKLSIPKPSGPSEDVNYWKSLL